MLAMPSAPAILLANDPRAYREALTEAIRALRPAIDVHLGDPETLDVVTAMLRPALVICSEVTETVRALAPAWALLYPDGAPIVETHIHGRDATQADMELAELLALVDEAVAPQDEPMFATAC